MSFFALIVALLFEQVRPLHNQNIVYSAVRGLSEALERNFNAGESQHGMLAWLILAIPLTLGAWLVFWLLGRVHPFLGLAWDVLVLYLTLGFRQFSHYYTDIQVALANNDLGEARRILTEWRGQREPRFSAAEFDLSDICRLAIEEALVASHRHVFGVFFWFVLLPGPAGAVLYRIADYLARKWNKEGKAANEIASDPFGKFAQRVFIWIDWIPVRLTAIGFAIVGNFEDAIFCWRNYARLWNDPARGILLSSGAGALGVLLGDAQSLKAVQHADNEAGEPFPGVLASPAVMRSGVGLVWRSMVLWLLLLLLLSVAGLFG